MFPGGEAIMSGPRALSGGTLPVPEDDQQATIARDYRGALEAVREAIDIPHAATVGDEDKRTAILLERAGHAVVMLSSVLDGSYPAPDIPWSVAYLRDRLAEHPAAGYKTWQQRVAELDAAKALDGDR
jgi:hypothetical protein